MTWSVPAICCGIAAVWGLWRRCDRPGYWRSLLLTAGLQYGGLAAVYFLLRRFAAGSDGNLPLWAVAAVCLPGAIALILSLYGPDRRWLSLFRRQGVAAAGLLLCECFLFNAPSLTGSWQSWSYPSGDLYYAGGSDLREDRLVLTGDGGLVFEEVPAGAGCLLLPLERERPGSPYTLTLEMRDGNFTEGYRTVATKQQVDGSVCRLSFRPYGEPVSLRLWFEGIADPVEVGTAAFATCLPFRFQSLRFCLLYLLAAALLGIIGFSLHRVRYRRDHLAHLICVGVTVALCVGLCCLFFKPGQSSYPYEGTPAADDPFALTFDAFQKGQVWLDIQPEPGLEELDNVYSYDQRTGSGIYYKWDLAYYQGRYYSYFGVTPVLTYYYPYYWIHGRLPDPARPVDFYALGSVLLLCLTLLKAVRLFIRRPNLLLLLLSLVAVTLCCGALYCAGDQSPKYQLPLVCGLFWLCGCLLAGMGGYTAKKLPARLVCFFISGASLALCFGARPTMALNAAWLVPLFLGILLSRRHSVPGRIGQAACFLLPLLAGGLGLMWYNQARFGSPFDFGAAYQLTVSDVHANGFRLSNLGAALFHYFLTPPAVTPLFPFIKPQWASLGNYQQYVYIEGVVGWLAYPMVLLGLLWLIRAVGETKARRLGTSPLQRKSLLWLCWLLPVALALADFSMGGVNQRYLYDIAPLLLMGSVLAILHRCRRPDRDRHAYRLACLAVIATCLFAALLLLTFPETNLLKANPSLYRRLEEMAVFWQ